MPSDYAVIEYLMLVLSETDRVQMARGDHPETLRVLSLDSSSDVRREVAKNLLTPKDVVEYLATQELNVPDHSLMNLLSIYGYTVRSSLDRVI